jgi:hypothetical protein
MPGSFDAWAHGGEMGFPNGYIQGNQEAQVSTCSFQANELYFLDRKFIGHVDFEFA